MKRIALLTVLAALFFGSLAVVLAGPSVPPQQYYIRWKSPVPYTCTHMPGDDRLVVITTYFDYNVPAGTQMSEEDTTHSSYGDTGGRSSVTDWAYPAGTGQHIFHGYQLDFEIVSDDGAGHDRDNYQPYTRLREHVYRHLHRQLTRDIECFHRQQQPSTARRGVAGGRYRYRPSVKPTPAVKGSEEIA